MTAQHHEAQKIEAAPPAQKAAPVLGCVGSADEFSGQLPPEQPRLDGMGTACSGVKSSPDEMRAKIFRLEAEILSHPQTEIPTTHHFAPGIYMRQVRIPAGTVVTGAIHKTEHLNILSQGVISVWTEYGMKTLRASSVIPSKPGIKRVGYAHEDSVWITVCHNPENETDTDNLEALLTTNSYSEFLEYIRDQETRLLYQGGK